MKKAVEQHEGGDRANGHPDATILEHLGDVYFQLQELDKASDAWAAEPPRPSRPTSAAEIRKKLESLEARPDAQALVESNTLSSRHIARKRKSSATVRSRWQATDVTLDNTSALERREMAGHSHSANIAHRKGLVDAKRGQALHQALPRSLRGRAHRRRRPRPRTCGSATRSTRRARSACPKDNIERSIKKATGELGAENFEEVIYEGYGPGGVAVLCEALTDNRNRTAGELRRRSRPPAAISAAAAASATCSTSRDCSSSIPSMSPRTA